jgi:hypothetical protein
MDGRVEKTDVAHIHGTAHGVAGDP